MFESSILAHFLDQASAPLYLTEFRGIPEIQGDGCSQAI